MKFRLGSSLLPLVLLSVIQPATASAQARDPFVWLEDLASPRAIDWVKARNAGTYAELSSLPAYPQLYDAVMRVVSADDRIAYPQIVGDRLYNFWQDQDHPRGLWRRSTWASYLHGTPNWEAVLDMDSLSKVEHVNWNFGGAECVEPDNRMCLVYLSRPNSDSTEVRALNVRTKRFSKDDFRVHASKLPGLPFFGVDAPPGTDMFVVRDQVVLYAREPITSGGVVWEKGSVLSTSVKDFLAGSRRLHVVMRPNEHESVEGVSATRSYLLVNMLRNVRGELRRYHYTDRRWSYERLPTADMGSLGIISTSTHGDRFFFTFESFLQPTTLYLAREDGVIEEVRRMHATFDSKGMTVEQLEATSKDGTRIPFFVVHRDGLIRDATNPTLLSAYGGFELSSTPAYNAVTAPLWLGRGGVFVLANIRGGGEFGPAWHRAAVRENRQRAYDDFTAVAEELVRLRITSPAHLGIIGASNGGLLTGVAFTQRPDLYGAVVMQSALLDMRNYTHMLGGSTWTDEYGDPDNPADWAYLSRYSPYENLKVGTKYPPVLFTTTTGDERVHPAHVRKMAAKMESLGLSFYYFESFEGGHGYGATTQSKATSLALTYTYLWNQLEQKSPR